MKKYQKVMIQDEVGNVEEYEQAVVLTCKQEDKVSISLVHSGGVDVAKAALALIIFADQIGMTPLLEYYLENAPITEAEYQISE